jgi:hypothetical protein
VRRCHSHTFTNKLETNHKNEANHRKIRTCITTKPLNQTPASKLFLTAPIKSYTKKKKSHQQHKNSRRCTHFGENGQEKQGKKRWAKTKFLGKYNHPHPQNAT